MSISDRAQENSRDETPNTAGYIATSPLTEIPTSSPLKKEIAESSSELSDINSSEVETDLMEDMIDSDLQRMATMEPDEPDETIIKEEGDSGKRKSPYSEPEQKRRKLDDKEGDADEDEEDNESTHNDEEEQRLEIEREKTRESALEDLTKIEVEFAELKDAIFQNQLSRLQFELELCVNGSHPEFIEFVSIINRNYEKRLSYITNSQKYQLKCIDDQTNAQRAQIHQQFIKNCQDLKTEYLWETTSEWYDINEERRKLDNKVLDIPDYYQFNPMLSTRDDVEVLPELVSQRNGLLLEISHLRGLQKYSGFPSSLYDLKSAKKEDIEKDLIEMGIRK